MGTLVTVLSMADRYRLTEADAVDAFVASARIDGRIVPRGRP